MTITGKTQEQAAAAGQLQPGAESCPALTIQTEIPGPGQDLPSTQCPGRRRPALPTAEKAGRAKRQREWLWLSPTGLRHPVVTSSARSPNPISGSDSARRQLIRPRVPRFAQPRPGLIWCGAWTRDPRRRGWIPVGTERPYPSPQLPRLSRSASPRASRSPHRLFPLPCPELLFPLSPPPLDPFRDHHGRGHRQRLDPPEAAGAGAALGPTVSQSEAEQPQQEPRALQWQPGGYLLQSAHLRSQEAQVAASRSVWVTVGRHTLGSPHLLACLGLFRLPLSSLGLSV